MNRFLTKKRAKKAPAEQKVELDLTSVLPSSDNFRTSLLMPGLSTRFSMLREQDDPNSLLGKASDDSVLMPKRRSRLNDFGYKQSFLGDIAEVSSLHGSIKPSFDPGRRQDSFASADGYGTDDESLRSGSIMTRARPGEGNVMFGGRQKIYKIPIGGQSERSLSGSSKGGMGGRALYEDDVNLSSFQMYKQMERERREREPRRVPSIEQDSPVKAPSTPSLLNYNNRRETSSSTTSGQNARSSTAATSVNSQGANAVPCASPGLAMSSNNMQSSSNLERTGTKSKRLYEQGLDREIQDQQNSTLNRLNSVQKGRNGLGVPYMAQQKGGPVLQDRFQRTPFHRAASPGPNMLPPISADLKDYDSPEDGPYQQPDSRPISPLGSDFDDHSFLSAAINPSDRGKATAMGAFAKPKPYTEAEYLQRQKLMQQGRSTPTSPLETPRDPLGSSRPNANGQLRPDPVDREITRSRSPTGSSQHSDKNAFSVFHSAAGQIKRNAEDRPLSPPLIGRSMFGTPVDSESEAESGPQLSRYGQGQRVLKRADLPNATLAPPPPHSDHPAFRPNSPFERLGNNEPMLTSQFNFETNSNAAEPGLTSGLNALSVNESRNISPITDTPSTAAGLSGLVRQHLRHGSDKSSVYEFPSNTGGPARANNLPTYSYGQGPPHAQDSTVRPSFTSSNPWDLDDLDSSHEHDAGANAPVSPLESSTRPTTSKSKAHLAGGLEPTSQNEEIPWEMRLRREHIREPSTETTAEGGAFANELAERQRAIQEKLRNNIENELRSTSPTPKSNGLKNILRAKSSRDSMHDRHEQPSKAKKLIGLGGSATHLPSLVTRRSEEDKVARGKYGVPIPPDPEEAMPTDHRERTRDRSMSRSTKGRSPPTSTRSSGVTNRNRSDSDVSGGAGGRSRSRGGRYKDDLDRAMAEGTSSRTVSMYPDSVYSTPEVLEEHPMPPPVPQIQPSFSSPRLRSNSRTHSPALPQGHWDQNGSLTPARSPNMAGPPSKFMPASGMNHLDTVSIPNFATRPSPSSGVSPAFSPAGRSPILSSGSYSANNTPPISGNTTPVYPPTSFNAIQTQMQMEQKMAGSLRSTQSRKRSIQKSEISEPTLIMTTSVVDTVSLPPGASLKNGQDEVAPPVPPINPRRKMFGFGRSNENSPAPSNMPSPLSYSPPKEQTSFFEEDDYDRSSSRSRQRLRKQPSDGKNLNERARKERERDMDMERNMPQIGAPQMLHQPVGSPPIMMTEGGMF